MSNYYNATDITIYPSSNATDIGKVTAEENVRDIVRKLKILNFTENESDFNISARPNDKIRIEPGIASIYAYTIQITEPIEIGIPQESGQYHVVLVIHLDPSDHIIGDIVDDDVVINEGVSIEFISTSETITNKMLIIGEITSDDGSLTYISNYPYKTCVFNADNILYHGAPITNYLYNETLKYISKLNYDSKIEGLDIYSDINEHGLISLDFDSSYRPYITTSDPYSTYSHNIGYDSNRLPFMRISDENSNQQVNVHYSTDRKPEIVLNNYSNKYNIGYDDSNFPKFTIKGSNNYTHNIGYDSNRLPFIKLANNDNSATLTNSLDEINLFRTGNRFRTYFEDNKIKLSMSNNNSYFNIDYNNSGFNLTMSKSSGAYYHKLEFDNNSPTLTMKGVNGKISFNYEENRPLFTIIDGSSAGLSHKMGYSNIYPYYHLGNSLKLDSNYQGCCLEFHNSIAGSGTDVCNIAFTSDVSTISNINISANLAGRYLDFDNTILRNISDIIIGENGSIDIGNSTFKCYSNGDISYVYNDLIISYNLEDLKLVVGGASDIRFSNSNIKCSSIEADNLCAKNYTTINCGDSSNIRLYARSGASDMTNNRPTGNSIPNGSILFCSKNIWSRETGKWVKIAGTGSYSIGYEYDD